MAGKGRTYPMPADLVELATRYVRLTGELEETRSAMRVALADGHGGEIEARPTKPRPKTPGKGLPRAEIMARSAKADVQMIAILRARALKPGELIRETRMSRGAVADRLNRLALKGLIEKDETGAWRAVSN
jgi:hypothetical protein